jgi:Ca2+-binding EF-hand superfamily protein
MDEFSEILKSGTLEHLSVTERIITPEIDILFRSLDDDENKLVDALEFLAALAMLSGMTPEEKVRCECWLVC